MALPFLPLLGIDQTLMTDINHLVPRLETLLVEGFSAEGSDLDAKVRAIGHQLPDDLREQLQSIAQSHKNAGVDGNDPIEFAFRCGQAHERLANWVHSQLAANIDFLEPDGTSRADIEVKDYQALASFVAWRDQFLRTVADYTLKFLLVSVILLVIGLSFGLI